ncbi:hypothetical protein E2C01_008847 [Portunus trituberculatus]|uniref:Uncharacterized protein n=1 Tax=Portunus trituberculatus TaxID=210409 RepID=A0A5B7D1W6_PORTR|nr:hypothetical protein [Portunus trituberculatus]
MITCPSLTCLLNVHPGIALYVRDLLLSVPSLRFWSARYATDENSLFLHRCHVALCPYECSKSVISEEGGKESQSDVKQYTTTTTILQYYTTITTTYTTTTTAQNNNNNIITTTTTTITTSHYYY